MGESDVLTNQIIPTNISMEHIKPLNVRNTTASTAAMMGYRQAVKAQHFDCCIFVSSNLTSPVITGGMEVRRVRFPWQSTLTICRMALTIKRRCVKRLERMRTLSDGEQALLSSPWGSNPRHTNPV